VSELFGTVFAGLAFMVLLWAGWSHLTTVRLFVKALEHHSIWPSTLVPIIAAIVVASELCIGGIGIAGFVFGSERLWTAALASAAGLYTTFLAYGSFLWLWRPSVPCGCSVGPGETEANLWVVVRAAILVLSSMAAFILREDATAVWPGAHRGLIVIAATTSLCFIVWNLPMTFGPAIQEGRPRVGL
jgi:hypothetical protein